MSKVCFGFEVHQPYRLNPKFNFEVARKKRKLTDIYFSSKNKEILKKVVDKCYIPATQIVLEGLDSGFKCAFSFSGTLIEQLERWGNDALDLFKQVAKHKNSEILAQTYYHSLAGLFEDKSELEEQILLHRSCMRNVFGVNPEVFENTEFIFNNSVAYTAKKLGFKAVFTEGVEKVLEWRSPNYVYSCNGIKILMRNYMLSDDIAFRFSSSLLTADKFAGWLAATSGDCINIFVDYETFGEHHWEESGILEFLRWLPVECMNRGLEFAKPSEVAEFDARDEIDVNDFATISWADVEKDTSAWLGNEMQRTAFREVKRAKTYAEHYSKDIWRYLQTSDHYYYMATKGGSSGEVHSYFSQQNAFHAFSTYMRVLSHYEMRCASRMKSRKAALALRVLPPEKAFHFCTSSGYTGFSAYSLDDFCECLKAIPEDSVSFHAGRGDFSKWVGGVLGERKLASDLGVCRTREEIIDVVDRRRCELWKLLK